MSYERITHRRKGGFTLVEMLVVISIIIILAGILAIGVKSIQESTNRTATMAMVGNLYSAIETYNAQFHEYPAEESWDKLHITTGSTDPNKPSIIDLLNTVDYEMFDFNHDYLRNNTLCDPWEQPMFYDVLDQGTDLFPQKGKSGDDNDWEDWNMTHEVAIFSVGPDNITHPAYDDALEWNKAKILFNKDASK